MSNAHKDFKSFAKHWRYDLTTDENGFYQDSITQRVFDAWSCRTSYIAELERENAKLHGWVRGMSQKSPRELKLEKDVLKLERKKAELMAQLKIAESMHVDSVRFIWEQRGFGCCAEMADHFDAISAQLEHTQQQFEILINTAQECDSWESFPQKSIDAANEVLNSTPTKYLNQIKAEAGRSGYAQGIRDWREAEEKYQNFDITFSAEEYAASIAKGEL